MSWRRRRRGYGITQADLPKDEAFTFSKAMLESEDNVGFIYKLKHDKKPGYVVNARVLCQGAIHTITCRQFGPITLDNHKNMKAEQTLMSLGGDKPQCIKYLEQFRNGTSTSDFANAISNHSLRTAYYLHVLWRVARSTHRGKEKDLLANYSFGERYKLLISRYYSGVLVKMDEYTEDRGRSTLLGYAERAYLTKKMNYEIKARWIKDTKGVRNEAEETS